MLKEILLTTYTIALPIILGYVVWLLKRMDEKRDAQSSGIMILLRIQLIEYHDKYIAQHSIPSYAYENFLDAYEAYHKLGGNGMIDKMKQEVEQLDIKNVRLEGVKNGK